MEILHSIIELRARIAQWKCEGKRVGFVPTMGFLHEGHASLMDRSVSENDCTVISVFVNPMQFGEGEDFERYPSDLAHDTALANAHGVDILFAPSAKEMYPKGFSSFVDMHVLTDNLCGASRPGHFRGVCTVVLKLFNIVKPDCAYFGEKDAQQLAVIRHMVEDLNLDLAIIGCPIVREEDGLAKSSRNTYLSPEERQSALVLSKAIALGKGLIQGGERESTAIVTPMRRLIESEPLARVDYVTLVDPCTIQPIDRIGHAALCAMAVYIGGTRLIDNFFFTEEEV